MDARVVQGFVAMEPPTVTHNDLMMRRGRGGKAAQDAGNHGVRGRDSGMGATLKGGSHPITSSE